MRPTGLRTCTFCQFVDSPVVAFATSWRRCLLVPKFLPGGSAFRAFAGEFIVVVVDVVVDSFLAISAPPVDTVSCTLNN